MGSVTAPGTGGQSGLDRFDGWPGHNRGVGWVDVGGRVEVAGDVEHPLRLASVTKVLTALAVLVAVEEESIALDEACGPAGSTVRHLLAHASGLPFEGTTPIAAPGKRRIYGNTSFEALGQLLSERSGLAVGDYVAEAVSGPLGMDSTTVPGSPAHSGRSTVADLLLLGAELLAPSRVIAPETLREATTVQYPGLDGVLPGWGPQRPNDWGLGFEIHGHKTPHWMPPEASPRTFGHFGQAGSFLWVDPDAGVACAGLSDKPFGSWAREGWPALGSDVLVATGR